MDVVPVLMVSLMYSLTTRRRQQRKEKTKTQNGQLWFSINKERTIVLRCFIALFIP